MLHIFNKLSHVHLIVPVYDEKGNDLHKLMNKMIEENWYKSMAIRR